MALSEAPSPIQRLPQLSDPRTEQIVFVLRCIRCNQYRRRRTARSLSNGNTTGDPHQHLGWWAVHPLTSRCEPTPQFCLSPRYPDRVVIFESYPHLCGSLSGCESADNGLDPFTQVVEVYGTVIPDVEPHRRQVGRKNEVSPS